MADRSNKPEQSVSLRDWIAVLGAVLGAFMAVLDIQITNSALKDIQGGIAASLDEGSWISTGYLCAEIVAIPLSAWMTSVLSTRVYLMGATALFIMFSMLCGAASDLPEMVLFRAGQGFTGGGLIPVAFSIVLTRLPPSKQPLGLALFGFTATFAPAIGPTLGGWLTDTYNWHYVFYVNVVPGVIMLAMLAWALDREPIHLERLRDGDWFGIAMMAVGLGSLIAVLEEGERKDWFGTAWIRDAAVVAAICIPLFVIRELTAAKPFINLKLLARRNVAVSALVGLAMGAGLYGSIYLLPVYLSQIQGYDALQIGEVIMWLGVPQLFILPFVPFIMGKVDTRYLVGFGFTLFAASCLMNGFMTHDTALPQLIFPQLVRALGQPFIIVPLSQLATAGIEKEQQGTASALFNIMRNLGGSIGISMLSTFTTIREQFHFSVIADNVTQNGILVNERIAEITQALTTQSGAILARMQAIETIRNQTRVEAYVMAYSDCFLGLAVILALSLPLIAMFTKPKPGAQGAAH